MNSNFCKIAFLGSDEIAIPLLNRIVEMDGFSLEAVLTQPDRPSGRGRKLRANPIKAWALERGCRIRDPRKPGSEELDWFEELQVDLLLVMAYGHILKPQFLSLAPLGCFNFHASLLPLYRGASPIETALASGESETGVTLMRVVPRMDAGPILDFEKVVIGKEMEASALRVLLSMACIPLVERNLPLIKSRTNCEKKQDDSQASYCRKLEKSDGALDFSLPALELSRRIRAFSSWPGCFFEHQNQKIKVGQARLRSDCSMSPGQVSILETGELLVGTGTVCLQFGSLQRPGGKMMPTADFLRGYEIGPDAVLRFEPSQPLLRRFPKSRIPEKNS